MEPLVRTPRVREVEFGASLGVQRDEHRAFADAFLQPTQAACNFLHRLDIVVIQL